MHRTSTPNYRPNIGASSGDPVVNTVSGITPDGSGDVQLTLNNQLPSGAGNWTIGELNSGMVEVTSATNGVNLSVGEGANATVALATSATLVNDVWTATGAFFTADANTAGTYITRFTGDFIYTKDAASRAKISVRLEGDGGVQVAIQEWAEDALLTDPVANNIHITCTATVKVAAGQSFDWSMKAH